MAETSSRMKAGPTTSRQTAKRSRAGKSSVE
jgi:hypothetical protein